MCRDECDLHLPGRPSQRRHRDQRAGGAVAGQREIAGSHHLRQTRHEVDDDVGGDADDVGDLPSPDEL